MRRQTPLVALFVLLFAVSCGGASNGPRVSSPFTEDDARMFDGAVDFVGEPEVLVGRWHDDWMNDLIYRARESDVIAKVTIRTIRTDTDLERRRTYRLIGNVDDVLVGERMGDDVNLRVRQDEAGFDTITGKEGRILDQSFLVFLKWYQPDDDEDAEVVARWHLSPATPEVLSQVSAALEQRGRSAPPPSETAQRGGSAPPPSETAQRGRSAPPPREAED